MPMLALLTGAADSPEPPKTTMDDRRKILLMCSEAEAALEARLGPRLIGYWPNQDPEGFADAIAAWLRINDEPDEAIGAVTIISASMMIEPANLGGELYRLRRRCRLLECRVAARAAK